MSLFEKILEDLAGKAHFMVFLGKTPAAEIKLVNKDVIIEVKNPIAAAALGIEEILRGKGSELNLLDQAKKMGFRFRLKYGRLEMDI